MSFGIYWEPAVPRTGTQLPQGLKYVIAQRFFNGGDGTLRGATFLTQESADYLKGVADATSLPEVREGAEVLLRALDKHGAVRVWIGNEDD